MASLNTSKPTWALRAFLAIALIGLALQYQWPKAGTAMTAGAVVLAMIFSGLISRRIRTALVVLERIGSKLTKEASQFADASVDIREAASELSHSTTGQATAITETVTGMDEIVAMLHTIEQNTSQTLDAANKSNAEASSGREIVSRMVAAMDAISGSNTKLDGIIGLIDEIKSKTKIINDIVFQTRLLSFNASIEAARAGANGRGFSIVAQEIGKLAAMSGKAAGEIGALLQSSANQVTEIISSTHGKVDAGKSVSQECEAVFSRMHASLESITVAMSHLETARREQENCVQHSNGAIKKIDNLTRSHSASADKLSVQATQLSAGAQSLHEEIKKLIMVLSTESRRHLVAEPEPSTHGSNKVNYPQAA